MTTKAKRCRHPKEAQKAWNWNVVAEALDEVARYKHYWVILWCSDCGSIKLPDEGWQHSATWEKKT